MPTSGYLADMIAHWEERRAAMPTDIEKHVRQRVYEAQRAEDQRRQKFRAEKAAEIADSLSPLYSNSLGAGVWRTKMAERGGLRSHIGN